MSLVDGILKVLLVLSVISIFGVDITSFVAVLAAAGFAIGLYFRVHFLTLLEEFFL
jgi:small conductance mechanosensitive channel